MRYAAHVVFVDPARSRPELWRLGVGLFLIALTYVGVIALMFLSLILFVGLDRAQAYAGQLTDAASPVGTLLLLASFLGMGLGPFLAARWIHRRRVTGLFGPRARVVRHFAIGAGICLGLYGLGALLPSDIVLEPNLDPALWAMLLPLALLGVLIQTGAEEILFRGYLQQQLAARFKSPLAWMMLPSVLFALLHFQPDTMGNNAWLMVLVVGLFAVLAADLTALTGSIGAAWGLHFANNTVAILFVAVDGPLSGVALFTTPFAGTDAETMRPYLLMDAATLVVVWALIRFAVTRRQAL